jgi:hypothetical protein
MENIYGFIDSKNTNITTYDLKGSQVWRFIKDLQSGDTWLDNNFILDRNGDPIVIKDRFNQQTVKVLE